jgi:hypothetical protein
VEIALTHQIALLDLNATSRQALLGASRARAVVGQHTHYCLTRPCRFHRQACLHRRQRTGVGPPTARIPSPGDGMYLCAQGVGATSAYDNGGVGWGKEGEPGRQMRGCTRSAAEGGGETVGHEWRCPWCATALLSAALLLLATPPGASAPCAQGAGQRACSDQGGNAAEASLRLRGGGIPKTLPRWSDTSMPRVKSMKQVSFRVAILSACVIIGVGREARSSWADAGTSAKCRRTRGASGLADDERAGWFASRSSRQNGAEKCGRPLTKLKCVQNYTKPDRARMGGKVWRQDPRHQRHPSLPLRVPRQQDGPSRRGRYQAQGPGAQVRRGG